MVGASLIAGAMGRTAPLPKHSGYPIVRSFTERDLPANPHTRAVAVAPGGLVYVATIEGLVEYDGVSWKLIRGTEGLIVHNVATTAAGGIFYSGSGCFGLLEPDARGELVARSLQQSLPEADRAVGHVLRLVVCGEDAWLAPQGPRPILVHVDGAGRVEILPIDGRCSTLFLDGDGINFVTPGGAWRIAKGARQAMPSDAVWKTANPLSVWKSSAGETWVVSADGLRRRTGDEAPLVSDEVRSLLAGDRVTAGCPVDGDAFLLGTDAHGVLLVGLDGRVLARHAFGDRFIPTSGKISSITLDPSGDVWITHYGGVVRARLNGPTTLHEQPADVPARVEAFAFFQGRLHAATTSGVLARNDATGHFDLLPRGGIDAWALLPTEDGLVVAGDDLRLIKPDGDVELIDAQRLGFRSVLRLRREPDRLLASTGPAGLLRLYRREIGTGGVRRWRFETDVPGIRTPLYPLVEDADGRIWGARNRVELVRLDWRGGVRLDALPERIGAEHGLPQAGQASFRVWLFAVDGRVEVCNWEGIWRHDPVADRFVAETRIAGLDPARWSKAFPLEDGSLWFANTQPGDSAALARRTGPGTWQLEPLPRSGLEAIRPTAVIDDPAAGVRWIGHLGLASVQRDWNRPQPAPPQAAVRSAATGDGRLLWGGAGAAPSAVLAPAEKSFRVSFAAPFFQADGDGGASVSHRTRLDGLDSDWSAWSEGTQREYSGLPPGKFRFRVQAKDKAGREGPEAAFSFVHLAPWWRSPWAWTAYVIAACSAVAGVVHLRTLQLQWRADKLASIVAERTAELLRQNDELARLHRLELDQKTAARLAEEQARLETLRYQLNPHFLFNALASVGAMIPPQAQSAKTMVARLAEFCRNTLYREDDSDLATIGAELRQLGVYLEIEKFRWGDLLEIETRCAPELESARLPSFLLLPLVENAIKYGRATSPDRIGVRLDVRREKDELVLEVSNTGEWIERGDASPDVHSLGVGLANLRERLERYYPRAHRFSISHGDGWVTAILRLRIP